MKHGKQSGRIRGPAFYFQEAYYLAKELERLPPDAPGRSRTADEALCAAEQAALAARRAYGGLLCTEAKSGRPVLLPRAPAVPGSVRVTPEGWTVVRLDTLLQNARRTPAGYLEGTILGLLRAYRRGGKSLPWYSRAFVVIIEHTGRGQGNVYDPDNREWKCVTNALKGALFEDDDQLTVSLLLDSVCDGKGFTEIAVLPYADAGKWFSER